MKQLIFETRGEDKLALITYAIVNKYSINFHYNGVNVKNPERPDYTEKGWRFVQPVAIGESSVSKRMMIRAWQTGGQTNTKFRKKEGETEAEKNNTGWRTFILDEISSQISVYDGAFGHSWTPFTNPPASGEEKYSLTGDEKMGDGNGTNGTMVTDLMVKDISVAEDVIDRGEELIMNPNQPGGRNLKDEKPIPEEPEEEVIDKPEEPEISIKDKYLARDNKKKANALKYRLIQKNKRDAEKLANLEAQITKLKDDSIKADPDSVENSVIKVKAGDGNPNNPSQTDTKTDSEVAGVQSTPDQPTEEPDNETDQLLKESSGWLKWINKFLENE